MGKGKKGVGPLLTVARTGQHSLGPRHVEDTKGQHPQWLDGSWAGYCPGQPGPEMR